jgi:hypothetical protein
MARVVTDHNIGVVADDFTVEAAARSLSALTAERVSVFKHHSHQAASRLCAEMNEARLVSVVQALIG